MVTHENLIRYIIIISNNTIPYEIAEYILTFYYSWVFHNLRELRRGIRMSYQENCYGEPKFWNVSKITDMSFLFYNRNKEMSQHHLNDPYRYIFRKDISRWDVSNVKNMDYMFCKSKFDGDISDWDVSSVTSMNCMFSQSDFNGDVSNWDVSSVTNMFCLFSNSPYNRDIRKWDVSNLKDKRGMFKGTKLEEERKIPEWY